MQTGLFWLIPDCSTGLSLAGGSTSGFELGLSSSTHKFTAELAQISISKRDCCFSDKGLVLQKVHFTPENHFTGKLPMQPAAQYAGSYGNPCQAATRAGCLEGRQGRNWGDPSSLPPQGGVSQHMNTAGEVLTGSIGSSGKTRDEPHPGSTQGDHSGAKGDGARSSTGHKLHCVESIQEISHLPHRPEVYPGDRHTTSRAQKRNRAPMLSSYGAPEPLAGGPR